MGPPEKQHGMQDWLRTLGYICLLEQQLNVTTAATAYSKTEQGKNIEKCFKHPMESFHLHEEKIRCNLFLYIFKYLVNDENTVAF